MFEARLDREDEPDLAVELDSAGLSTGVEREVSGEEAIREPFDPEKIDVATRTPTVALLLSRIQRGALDLQPDFQRLAGIWTQQAQSRLIESMLLRLPLPTFYAAEADDARWVMVDGIQRLTAMARFIAPEDIGAAPSSSDISSTWDPSTRAGDSPTCQAGCRPACWKPNWWCISSARAHRNR